MNPHPHAAPRLLAAAAAFALAACAAPADEQRDSTQASAASAAASAAGPSPGAPSAASGPCSLFTQAQMSEVLGAPVTRLSEQSSRKCIYYTANPVVYVDLELDREGAEAGWAGVTGGDSLIGAPQDSTAGLGDGAFFGPRDRLYVRKGRAFLAIEAGFDDGVRARARKVARAALERLSA